MVQQGQGFVRLPPGQKIFTQGELANSIFFISSGRVKLSLSINGESKTIVVLDQGEFFGEHCLGYSPYRQITATTLEATTLIQIDKDDMAQALKVQPTLREAFIRNLIDRKFALEKLRLPLDP